MKHVGFYNGSRRMRKLLLLFYVLSVKVSSENRRMGGIKDLQETVNV